MVLAHVRSCWPSVQSVYGWLVRCKVKDSVADYTSHGQRALLDLWKGTRWWCSGLIVGVMDEEFLAEVWRKTVEEAEPAFWSGMFGKVSLQPTLGTILEEEEEEGEEDEEKVEEEDGEMVNISRWQTRLDIKEAWTSEESPTRRSWWISKCLQRIIRSSGSQDTERRRPSRFLRAIFCCSTQTME